MMNHGNNDGNCRRLNVNYVNKKFIITGSGVSNIYSLLTNENSNPNHLICSLHGIYNLCRTKTDEYNRSKFNSLREGDTQGDNAVGKCCDGRSSVDTGSKLGSFLRRVKEKYLRGYSSSL